MSLVTTILLHGMAETKGRVLWALWVVMVRQDPSSVPPTVTDRRPPPGAGVGPFPSTTPYDGNMPCEDMLKALKLLQSVMAEEDFSKKKMMMPPPPKREERMKLREEELFQKCKKEESLRKQEQMHLEQVKKHEHNLEQQKLMLEVVQVGLEAVRDEVKALRALVPETEEPEGPPIQLPAPRDPLPVGNEHATPIIDLDTVPPETHSELIPRAQKIEFESCK